MVSSSYLFSPSPSHLPPSCSGVSTREGVGGVTDGGGGRGAGGEVDEDGISFYLTWGDILLEPDNWPEYYFGVYSTNKYRFAIDVLGLTDWPQTARITDGPEDGVYTISEIQGFATKLNEAYEEYREEYGPIYVDDDAEVLEEIYYGSD